MGHLAHPKTASGLGNREPVKPLFTRGAKRGAVPPEDEDIALAGGRVRLRQVLHQRASTPLPAAGALTLQKCDEARRFWSERAWSEYAAVPAMSQTILALVRDGGSMDELGAISQMAADEVRHTELSRDVAEAFGGYTEDIPSGLPYAPQSLADNASGSFAQWVVGNGCVSETLSLELMRARLQHTRHPAIAEVLQRILQDEAVHARTSWLTAERVVPMLDGFDREVLSEYVLELVEVVRRTFVTSGLPAAVRDEARRIRNVTAEAGLGACPADEADALVEAKLEQVILPRLTKLGLFGGTPTE